VETKINNLKINYELYGEGKDTIVLLHGWGQNIEMMKPVGDNFKKEFNILVIDLPGFGGSEEPKIPLEVIDYVHIVHLLLEKLKINNPILVGHSFGGKISLLYASMYQVKKMILFSSPFKKEIKKLSLKTKFLKFCKKIPIIKNLEGYAKKKIGSTDYKNASDMMRKILVNTVNLDITEEVKKITCPTIIIWGTNDSAVPVERAYELESLIKDAGAIIYDNCTHYAYLERLGQTINIIRNFLGGK